MLGAGGGAIKRKELGGPSWSSEARVHSSPVSSVTWQRGTVHVGVDERIKPRKHKLFLEGFLKKVAPEK